MNCKFIMKDGTACKGFAGKKSAYCFVHNPVNKAKHKQSARKGGKASIKQDLVQAGSISIFDTNDVLGLLGDTINRVRRIKKDGSMDIGVANCLGFLIGKIIEAKKQISKDRIIEKELEKYKTNDELASDRFNKKFDRLYKEDPVKTIKEIIQFGQALLETEERNM